MQVLLVLLLGLVGTVDASGRKVVGNFAVVANPVSHAGTKADPVRAKVGALWCAVQNLGEPEKMEYGLFTRVKDGKEYEGDLVEEKTKVKLSVGEAPATVAGKYRCEVRMPDGDVLSGNSFIYLPPVLNFPNNQLFEQLDSSTTQTFKITISDASPSSSLMLRCPVFGYPQPYVSWEKDGAPLDSSRVTYDGDNIIIKSLEEQDLGIYKCQADNSFPMFVDGPAMPHKIILQYVIKL